MRKPHGDGISIQSPFSFGLIFTHHKVLESCVLIQVKRMDVGCFPSKRSLVHFDIYFSYIYRLKTTYKWKKNPAKNPLTTWLVYFLWLKWLLSALPFLCMTKRATGFSYRTYMIISMVSLSPERFCRQLQWKEKSAEILWRIENISLLFGVQP